MLIPNFGMGGLMGGSSEWEPQGAPSDQMSVNRSPYPDFDRELMLPEMPGASERPNRLMSPSQLPVAEEFRPHRALTMAEIAELQMPGGRERVVARMRQEQAGGAVRDDAFDFAVPNVPMPPRRPPGL
jgi:hypothetical protein